MHLLKGKVRIKIWFRLSCIIYCYLYSKKNVTNKLLLCLTVALVYTVLKKDKGSFID